MRATGILLLGFVLAAPAACQDKKERKGKITVGKETTYITGPLDKYGYVDYVTALNERLRKGITPENNANVLLWRAVGPHPEGATIPEDYFRRLGIPAPPEGGDYFRDLLGYLEAHQKLKPGEGAEAVEARLERLRGRPWTAREQPLEAAWLKANARPLALAVAASRRSQFYSPALPVKAEKKPPLLFGTPVPGLNQCRRLTDALTARAMLRAGEGQLDDAWQDLLACHRLARLFARGGGSIDFLVGVAIDGIAAHSDLVLLESVKPGVKQLARFRNDLRKLPAFPLLADQLDLGERVAFLELVTMIARHGAPFLEALADEGDKAGNALFACWLQNLDWDSVQREVNQWFDRLAAAAREPDHAARRKKLDDLDIAVKLLKNKVAQWGVATAFLGAKQVRGKMYGEAQICLRFPALLKVQQADDRIRQIHGNLLLAFALEAYRRDQGRYPKALDALAPKYLRRVPRDVFTGEALIYRPSAKGYLLYSVGPNARDNGGRGQDDEPRGDDVSVRMPLPKR